MFTFLKVLSTQWTEFPAAVLLHSTLSRLFALNCRIQPRRKNTDFLLQQFRTVWQSSHRNVTSSKSSIAENHTNQLVTSWGGWGGIKLLHQARRRQGGQKFVKKKSPKPSISCEEYQNMATSYCSRMCRISANTFGDENSCDRSTATAALLLYRVQYGEAVQWQAAVFPKQHSHRPHLKKMSRLYLLNKSNSKWSR